MSAFAIIVLLAIVVLAGVWGYKKGYVPGSKPTSATAAEAPAGGLPPVGANGGRA